MSKNIALAQTMLDALQNHISHNTVALKIADLHARIHQVQECLSRAAQDMHVLTSSTPEILTISSVRADVWTATFNAALSAGLQGESVKEWADYALLEFDKQFPEYGAPKEKALLP